MLQSQQKAVMEMLYEVLHAAFIWQHKINLHLKPASTHTALRQINFNQDACIITIST